MASVNVRQKILAPACSVWSVIADFGGVMRILNPKTVSRVECNGNQVGDVRHIFLADGSVIPERIELIEHSSMRLIYSIVEDGVLPVSEYVATVKISEIDSSQCQLDWQSTFAPVGSTENAEKTIESLYLNGIEKIEKIVSE